MPSNIHGISPRSESPPCKLVYHIYNLKYVILVSIVVSIPACHAGDQGSIPWRGGFFFQLLHTIHTSMCAESAWVSSSLGWCLWEPKEQNARHHKFARWRRRNLGVINFPPSSVFTYPYYPWESTCGRTCAVGRRAVGAPSHFCNKMEWIKGSFTSRRFFELLRGE